MMNEPVLTVAQMRALDEYVINRDDAAIILMGRAGEALADELANFKNIAVVCGPGNNGGDGYAAIYSLQERNLLDDKHATIFYTKEPKSDESKFFQQKITHKNVNMLNINRENVNFREKRTVPSFSEGPSPASFDPPKDRPQCESRTVPKCSEGPSPATERTVPPDGNFEVIVDCLLGTGFSGVPRGDIKDAIEAINNTNAFVISMDINSGVNGDTGDGEIAVKSDLTLSVGYLKTGMLEPCFKKWSKKVRNRNIGYTEEDLKVLGIKNTLSKC